LIFWFDPADKKARVDLDGGAQTFTSATALTSGTLEATTGIVQMGSWSNGSLDADMDEVAVYARVLTAPERTDLWNGGAGLFYGD
jgi:hypothetical protein